MTTPWNDLPVEIRLMILNSILLTDGSLANCAAVCREWQAVIERHNFSWIKLTIPRLREFDSMTRRTQIHVRYLWVCLELQEYGGAESTPLEPELQGMSNADSTTIKTAFEGLFETLSTWGARADLVLDISIHSPSDSAHWFKYLSFEPDVPFHQRDCSQPSEHMQPVPAMANNNQHRRTGDEIPLNHHAIGKVFDDIMGKRPFRAYRDEDRWWLSLPLVPAVTAVILRQQTRRRWKPKALSRLLSQFPRLREIHYEPWREWDALKQRATDNDYQWLLDNLAPCHLKTLVLFENFNERYAPYFKLGRRFRDPAFFVGRALAITSLMLDHLSVSFITDASQFLYGCGLSWKWYSLKTLILTSQLLTPNSDPAEVSDMLFLAAATARRMPNLELFEIWNGRAGLAALFRYQTSKYMRDPRYTQPTVITWRATWEFTLRPLVIQGWETVTHRHHGNTYIIDRQLVDANLIKSHADAIHHLGISKLVIRPVSLRQIQTEHMVGEEMFLAHQN